MCDWLGACKQTLNWCAGGRASVWHSGWLNGARLREFNDADGWAYVGDLFVIGKLAINIVFAVCD